MKKYLMLFLGILFLSCAKQPGGGKLAAPVDDVSDVVEDDNSKPLIIGGKQYRGYVAEYQRLKPFTVGDIDTIETLVLRIDPLNITEMDNLEGIEQLFGAQNIKSIGVYGKNLDSVDLTPLEQFSEITSLTIRTEWESSRFLPDISSFKFLTRLRILDTVFEDPYTLEVPSTLTGLSISGENLHNIDLSVLETLHDLRGIRIDGDIARLPDLTGLENLRFIAIAKGSLESLEGIGAPNARAINIENRKELDSLAPLNNLLHLEELNLNSTGRKEYRIADMSNLPSLKELKILWIGDRLDLQGIENLAALERLSLPAVGSLNIEGISALLNLQHLVLNLISPEPSLEFLRGMPNLLSLHLNADYMREGFPYESEAYQVLDLSPLATVKTLRSFGCSNFIIKNISSLDTLESLAVIDDDDFFPYLHLYGSKLFDETETSRHCLVFWHLAG